MTAIVLSQRRFSYREKIVPGVQKTLNWSVPVVALHDNHCVGSIDSA